MRQFHVSISKLLTCVGLALAAAVALCQMSAEDFVLVDQTAYGLLGPETAIPSFASRLQWSDDGRYLLGLRQGLSASAYERVIANPTTQGIQVDQSIVVYDSQSRNVRVLWSSNKPMVQISDVSWFRQSQVAIATIVEYPASGTGEATAPRTNVVLLDAASGASKVIFSDTGSPAESDFDVQMSPVRPIALLVARWIDTTPAAAGTDKARWHLSYRVIQPTSIGQPLQVDDGAFFMGWSEDGIRPYLLTMTRDRDGKIQRTQHLLDIETGKLTPAKEAHLYKPAATATSLRAELAGGAVSLETSRRNLTPAWLTGQEVGTHAMISSDATEVLLSPNMKNVAYVTQGVAMVRPIVGVPKDVLLKAREAAARTRALSQAKQVGLALIMYASDMDDTLPNSQADIGKLVEPYLKNSDLTNGFVYAFGGGLLTDVKDPANTVMGYVNGPGGKAVVYVDGHAKWVPDK